jgi:hypothetical protein
MLYNAASLFLTIADTRGKSVTMLKRKDLSTLVAGEPFKEEPRITSRTQPSAYEVTYDKC